MQRLREKLHNSSGASMLMALLLILVALMVSAVIIAAAGSAAVSIRGERAQQQAYLTVSSAAELLRDELEKGCTYQKTVTTTYKTKYNNGTYGNPVGDPEEKEVPGTSNFYSVISKALEQVQTHEGSTFRETYTFSTEGLDDVTAELLLKADTDSHGSTVYRLTVWFSGGESPNQCRICLTMDGIADTSRTEAQKDVTESKWVDGQWKECTWEEYREHRRNSNYKYEWDWQDFEYKYYKWVAGHYEDSTVTYYYTVTETTSVEWKNANIQKKEVQPNA